MIYVAQFHCPLGYIFAAGKAEGLVRLDFLDEHLNDVDLEKLAKKHFLDDEVSLKSIGLLDSLKKELGQYFLGKRRHFETPIILEGTTFQKLVWQQLLKIPYGTTISYGELAVRVGRTTPGQSRAVANANSRNPIAILVPCHRVVGVDGSLTGYAGGVWRKQALLVLEGARLL